MNPITPKSFEISRNYRNPRLERILSNYDVESDMDFSHQQINDQDMHFIVNRAMIAKKCTGLNLCSNEITSVGISILAAAIQSNITLQKLYLWENSIGDEGIHFLTDVLSYENTALKDLRIGWTGLTDTGVSYLAEMLKINTTFTNLWMRENKISDYGMQLLADALGNQKTHLEVLWLRGNTLITDASIPSVKYLLKQNRSLKQLSLQLCSISNAGKDELQEIAKQKEDFDLWV